MTDELLFDMLTSVAAMVMVTRMNLPASSIHVFAGSLLGVGMVDGIRVRFPPQSHIAYHK